MAKIDLKPPINEYLNSSFGYAGWLRLSPSVNMLDIYAELWVFIGQRTEWFCRGVATIEREIAIANGKN